MRSCLSLGRWRGRNGRRIRLRVSAQGTENAAICNNHVLQRHIAGLVPDDAGEFRFADRKGLVSEHRELQWVADRQGTSPGVLDLRRPFFGDHRPSGAARRGRGADGEQRRAEKGEIFIANGTDSEPGAARAAFFKEDG